MSQCKTQIVELEISAEHSSTRKPKRKKCKIDVCIADIIIALNESGVLTDGCCCGHGREPGLIILRDGRELDIRFPDGYEHKRGEE